MNRFGRAGGGAGRGGVAAWILGLWLATYLAVARAAAEVPAAAPPESPATEPAAAAAAEAPEEPSLEEQEINRVGIEDPFRPRNIVEAIEVRGNSKTRGDLIITRLVIKTGEVLDEEKVQESRLRLLALGYFKDVRMSLEKGSLRRRVKLVVEVEERNSIIIDDLFFGWSDTNPFWGGLGISELNFLGRGLVLSGGFVASEFQQAGRLMVFWPSIFNSRFQAGIQAIVSLGEERSPGRPCPNGVCPDACTTGLSGQQNLPYQRYGGILNFGVRLDPVHRLSVETHTEHLEADVPADVGACRDYPYSGYIKDGQSTLSSLAFRFERDTRDDFFLPTTGMYLMVSVELASKIFGSDYEFSKYMVKYEQSFPAFLDHAFRFTVVGGLIQYVGTTGSPFFSRFFVGDYAFFQVDKYSLPRNLELNFSEVVDYGDLLASLTVEYDIPLWSTGSFFYKGYVYVAGNFSYLTKAAFLAAKDEWSGRTKRPVSFDLGFKFDTPVGLLTVSLGYIMDMAF